MQYRLKEKDKLHKKDLEYNMEGLRGELQESIQYEEHRSNVDQAKKRAVKQLMDYNNFQQMVLGADLKPLKRQELRELVNMGEKRIDRIFNPINQEEESETNLDKQGAGTEGKDVDPSNLDIKTGELEATQKVDPFYMSEEELKALPAPKNFRDYKKLYDQLFNTEKNYSEESKCRLFKWLSYVPKASYRRIFSIDFDINYLINLVDILLDWVKDEQSFEDHRVCFAWFLDFLRDLTSLSTFGYGIKTMMKGSHKILMRKLLDLIGERNEIMAEFAGEVKEKFK